MKIAGLKLRLPRNKCVLTSTETTSLITDGNGEEGGGGGTEVCVWVYTYSYTVTTRMTPALRWATLMLN